MPKIASLGALSSRGFGEFAQQTSATYIEDVFSTYLYTGNGSTQTITNGIDLSGKGGLVWLKNRNSTEQHRLYDTNRTGALSSEQATPQSNGWVPTYFNFNSSGFFVNASGGVGVNTNSNTYVSWAFRKQLKFFDCVAYTGTGVAGLTINHNLGSVPGMIIVKSTNLSEGWAVYHRSNGNTKYQFLNTTAAAATSSNFWNNTTPTATSFTLGNDASVNDNGSSYVAYLFAHDAGGFGLDGTQNVISCGSFTTDSSTTATVTLGYEPQFILVKSSTSARNWRIFDTMRGWVDGGAITTADDAALFPNLSNAETNAGGGYPNSTGFTYAELANDTYIYMAIRRGPMKVPTDATTVFTPQIYTGDYNSTTPVTGMLPATDLWWNASRTATSFYILDRLRGWGYMYTPSTAAESTSYTWNPTTQTTLLPNTAWWGSSTSQVSYFMKRAPGFMDEVCYTGTATNRTLNHNLGVVPELIITKVRSAAGYWWAVYAAPIGATKYLLLNDATIGAGVDSTYWNDTAPTSSVFSVGANSRTNLSGGNLVAYLFASCPSVSKVGSYTGTGATQTISCGFTGGARFVLIRRTDAGGSWWVWDTARGMVSGTDPRIATNVGGAETNANWVYTTTGGFQIVTSDATVNASGGSYIYLAIA